MKTIIETLKEAARTYAAMSEADRILHDLQQRRSFAGGACPSHRSYEDWCKEIDKYFGEPK